MFHGVRIWC